MPRVVRIDKIEGLSDRHVANLHQHGIKTVDELWSHAGSNFDAGIKQVSEAANVPECVITALLIADGLGEVKINYGWLSRFQNARTYVILVLLAAVASAIYLFGFRAGVPQQVVVINPRGIAPYQVISKDDVALRRVPFRTGQTVSDLPTVIGGYALTKLEPKAPIRSNQILAADVARGMTGRYIVSVPVKADSLVLAPRPGAKLWLLPLPEQSKDKSPSPTTPIEALLLGVEKREGAVTLVVAVENIALTTNALMNGATIVSVMP